VTAASEHAAPDRERAETYLRLLAETELRRAIAMPEYKPPRERRPARMIALLAHSRRMRRRRARLRQVASQQAASRSQAVSQRLPTGQPGAQATPLPPLLRRAAESLESARALAAGPTASMRRTAARTGRRLGARMRSATWPLGQPVRRKSRHRSHQPPPAESCLTRLATVAGVIAALGFISAQTEEDIVGGLRLALAARSRIDARDLLRYRRFRGQPMRRRAGRTAASASLRAIPVGAVAEGEVNGHRVRFSLGVLLVDQGSAILTARARLDLGLTRDREPSRADAMIEALNEITASDDLGNSYRGSFSGGGGDHRWDIWFHLSPPPPAAARWLDVVLPGAPAVRVRLDVAPRDLQVTSEPVTTSAADRFLDAQTIKLLRSGRLHRPRAAALDDEPVLFWLASQLLAAGVVTADSASLRRLAAAAARLGEDLPSQLSGIQADELPADWVGLLAAADRGDGPDGMVAIAVALPEVDGARCVIGELFSEADGASLHVHCAGWPEPHRHGLLHIDRFWWSARDDLGGWYDSDDGSGSYRNGHADLDLRFRPAISPRARTLDIILTGITTQVTVTVPLDWQEAL